MNKEIKAAIKLLEENGYTVLNPEQTEIQTAGFEQWWKIYDKKCGKSDCMKKWQKLTLEEQKACLAATPDYVASTPDKQFRKHPLTFLNQKAWNDEIIIRDTAEQKRQQRLAESAELVAKYGGKA